MSWALWDLNLPEYDKSSEKWNYQIWAGQIFWFVLIDVKSPNRSWLLYFESIFFVLTDLFSGLRTEDVETELEQGGVSFGQRTGVLGNSRFEFFGNL